MKQKYKIVRKFFELLLVVSTVYTILETMTIFHV